MSTAISLRLPSDIDKALKRLSTLLERPKSYLICKALESYLAEHAEYQIALDRLRDKDDPILTSTEIRKRLA